VDELASDVDGRQPVAELVGEVVTRAACTVTLDERSRTEVFQTRARTGQRLTAAIRTGTSVLHGNTTHQQQNAHLHRQINVQTFISELQERL